MKLNNLAIFTLANSIASFAGGLFGPFYVVYIQQIGGSTAFLGDVTQKRRRGIQIGKYNAIIGVFSAFAIIIGGMLISKFGFRIIFYAISSLFFISTSLLFLIKERRNV